MLDVSVAMMLFRATFRNVPTPGLGVSAPYCLALLPSRMKIGTLTPLITMLEIAIRSRVPPSTISSARPASPLCLP